MPSTTHGIIGPGIASIALILFGSPLLAHDVSERLSVGGVVAATYCRQAGSASDDTCLGIPFRPELSFRPGPKDELFVSLGFAAGRTLDARVAPWAADLEDDVREINGRGTDHLLTAWYRRTASFGNGSSLAATIGIIDATDYLDDNAYANDEFAQFMNVALVNGPNVFLPSYDKGVALDWQQASWSLRGVYMNITENDDGRSYDFYGAQLARDLYTPIGRGTYRLVVDSTDRQFAGPEGRARERCLAAMLSFDQQLGDVLGAFVRIGKQDDGPAIEYETIYSGGIQLDGQVWGRPADTIGLGYAHLDGGNLELSHSQVLEAYYRVVIREFLAISGDVQHLADDLDGGGKTDRFIFGLRFAVEF